MDLVEICNKPPVCRVMDYGKYFGDQAGKRSQEKTNVLLRSKEVQIPP